MRIENIDFDKYILKFRSPLKTSQKLLTEKEIILVKLTDELGNSAIGECGPMPWFGTENIEDVIFQISNLSIENREMQIDETFEFIEEKLSSLQLLPTLKFAIEQALFKAAFKRNNSFAENFIRADNAMIKVNAVADLFLDDAAIHHLLQNGIDTFKFKVGVKEFHKEISQVKQLADKFDNRLIMRLDANGGWTFDQAADAMRELNDCPIEYLEQPVKEIKELSLLAEMNSIPIAADESVINLKDAESILNDTPISHLVVKPMFIGGLGPIQFLNNQANKKNKKLIVSSAFESSVGRAHTSLCAAMIESSDAHGLDTAKYLANDIAEDQFKVKDGFIKFNLEDYFSDDR